MVADGDGACLFVYADAHGQVAQFALELTRFSQCLHLLSGIHSVGNHLAEEDLMV